MTGTACGLLVCGTRQLLAPGCCVSSFRFLPGCAEMSFMYHAAQPFKVHAALVCSVFADFCNRHHNVRTFFSPYPAVMPTCSPSPGRSPTYFLSPRLPCSGRCTGTESRATWSAVAGPCHDAPCHQGSSTPCASALPPQRSPSRPGVSVLSGALTKVTSSDAVQTAVCRAELHGAIGLTGPLARRNSVLFSWSQRLQLGRRAKVRVFSVTQKVGPFWGRV